MSLGVTPIYKWALQPPGEFISIIQVTGDTAYPNTGGTIGYPITPATFSLNTFASTSDDQLQVPPVPGFFVWSDLAAPGSAGGFAKIDSTTGNLRMFGSTGTEIANSATAAAITVTLVAFGH